MAAIANGPPLHGGVIPYDATFIPSRIRAQRSALAALMSSASFTSSPHDSIGLGEDGPTHQPVEHAATLRSFRTWTCGARAIRLKRGGVDRRDRAPDGPSSLLSRRTCLFRNASADTVSAIARGGCVLTEAAAANPGRSSIAQGSEVQLAVEAQKMLADEGFPVASCPAFHLVSTARTRVS